MSILSLFGFQVLWSPLFFIFLLSVLIMYYLIIGPLRSRFPNSKKVSKMQQFYFVSGMILIYVAKGSPIDVIGHIIFSAHMMEMALLFIVVPPLLLLGLPSWLLEKIVSNVIVAFLLRIFAKPLFALFLFNGLFSMYHLPVVFDTVMQSYPLHLTALCILFFTAIMMWWPVLNPLPTHQTLNEIKKIAYIFAAGVILTPACALIIFASQPLFATYSEPQAWMQSMELCVPTNTLSTLGISGPEFFNGLPLLEDQQAGGVIMKIVQEIVNVILIGYVFFQWVKKEKEEVPPVPLYVSSNENS